MFPNALNNYSFEINESSKLNNLQKEVSFLNNKIDNVNNNKFYGGSLESSKIKFKELSEDFQNYFANVNNKFSEDYPEIKKTSQVDQMIQVKIDDWKNLHKNEIDSHMNFGIIDREFIIDNENNFEYTIAIGSIYNNEGDIEIYENYEEIIFFDKFTLDVLDIYA